MSPFIPKPLRLALAAAFAAVGVHAAEETNLSPVVVAATRTPLPVEQAPASLSVVTQDDIAALQASRIGQAVRQLPNVEFGGGPRANGEIASIRGYAVPSITLLVDGARQNWGSSNTLRSPLYIDPYFIGQAEVLRGPASSLYGAGGNGGAMVLRTLEVSDFLASDQTFGGGARFGVSGADRGQHLNARVYARNEVIDGLLAIGQHHWGTSVRQGGDTHLSPNDGGADSALMKLGANVGGLRLDLSHLRYDSRNQENSNPQADSLLAGAPAVQRMFTHQQQTVFKAVTTPSGDAPALAFSVYDTETRVSGERGSNPVTQPQTLWQTQTRGGSLQGSIGRQSGLVAQRLTAGLDYYQDRQTTANSYLLIAPPKSTQEVTGFFVQDEIRWGSLTITPSLRHDQFATAVDGGSSTQASHWSPKLAMAWQLDSGLMVYGSYGEAFRAPTINEMYTQLSTTAAFMNFRANPGLRPESDRTFEIGAKFKHQGMFRAGDQLQARASLFDGKARDLISSVVVGTYVRSAPFVGTGSILQSQNIANASRRGGEAELAYRWADWQLNGAYSRVRVSDEQTGNGLFSPPDKLALRIGKQWPGSGLSLAWTTTAVAAQDYDATLARRRPGFATHDLFAAWAPAGQRYRFDVGVTNLGDKRYSTYQSGNTFAYTYQEGRSVRAALNLEF